MSTISGVSGSGNTWAALSAQRSSHQARMFAKVDADSSGGVDQTELTTMLDDIGSVTGVALGDSKELFGKMDSNADGSLSSDELSQGMKALMPPPPSTMEFAQSRTTGSRSEVKDDPFARIDTNTDGSVDAAELKALTDKIFADTGQDLSAQLSKLDTDSDGKLSQAEFEAGRPEPPAGARHHLRGMGGPESSPSTGGASSSSNQSETFDPLDTNRDGTVSSLERLVGELQDASAQLDSPSDANNTATKLDIATLARQIYAQVAQSLGATASTGLRVSA